MAFFLVALLGAFDLISEDNALRCVGSVVLNNAVKHDAMMKLVVSYFLQQSCQHSGQQELYVPIMCCYFMMDPHASHTDRLQRVYICCEEDNGHQMIVDMPNM